jgi:serine/threonine-protein kinase PRP4
MLPIKWQTQTNTAHNTALGVLYRIHPAFSTTTTVITVEKFCFYRAVLRKTHSVWNMTNVPSGSKRLRDGSPENQYKRPREESRDWRDVHLRSPRGKPPIDKDRRDNTDKRRNDYRPRSRDYERRRPRGYSRERERDRERDRRHDRERDYHSRRDDSRKDDRRRHESPRRHSIGNAIPRQEDSEREEGE